ncbi:anks1b [Symbiodinium pilosum]|uniref:Anks1b protein n=1 Tax=Symbiodinium pilosum TaxID=2952 RepID=A0A812THY1_SYMPI|nr:anks1b [Symbiodinium pilosum]
MLFPMYTVAAEVLLKMTEIRPHEELKVRGDLVIFDIDKGNALFVSHQWVAEQHPDPEFRQMSILQNVLRHLMTSSGSVPLDYVTETLVFRAKPLPMHVFQSSPLFIWYDYFSCPQLEICDVRSMDGSVGSQQDTCIHSISAYVEACRFFLALCPVIDSPREDKVFTARTWSCRGWCRMERAARELSVHDTWILVQSSASFELVGTALSFPSASVGEGEFTVAADRDKLAPIVRSLLWRKLRLCLQKWELPAYRRLLNLQTVHLRGLAAEPIKDLVPGFSANAVSGHSTAAESFLRQNMLTTVSGADNAGWRPLHYAALSGNVDVVEGLLRLRANPNQRTLKDVPQLGLPLWMSPLDLAIFYKHNDAAQLILAARAQPEGGFGPALQWASNANNEEGARLLCSAGSSPFARNLLGPSALDCAAAYGSMAALEELLQHCQPTSLDASRALLSCSDGGRGASAEMVQRLIDLRADVNFQQNLRRDWTLVGRVFMSAQAMKHRFGTKTVGSTRAYHASGSTPLMWALVSAQYEGAAALLAAGARLDICNCRGWRAEDFVKGLSIPAFLQQGLEGDPSACRRVACLALSDADVFQI